jgi:hypothetical protein
VEIQGSDIGMGPAEPSTKPDIKIEPTAEKPNVDSKIVKLEVKSKVVDWGKIVILQWEHSVAATTSDWIGLYRKGEPSNQRYLTWEYVTIEHNSAKSGMILQTFLRVVYLLHFPNIVPFLLNLLYVSLNYLASVFSFSRFKIVQCSFVFWRV